MNSFSRALAWSAAACAAMALSGCTALHSVVSPMMQSAMQNSVEKNATPESMGIGTSAYRGHDCAYLAGMAQTFTRSQNDPATEPFTRKTFGWHVDAINQVRAEQGCVAGVAAKVPASGEVPMYGFCWYAEPSGVGATYFSPVFAYVDWYADQGQHEQKEFEAYLKSRYAPKPSNALCQGEDTRAKADAAREKLWGLMFGNLSSSRVSVAWTPLSKPPRRPAARSPLVQAPPPLPVVHLSSVRAKQAACNWPRSTRRARRNWVCSLYKVRWSAKSPGAAPPPRPACARRM